MNKWYPIWIRNVVLVSWHLLLRKSIILSCGGWWRLANDLTILSIPIFRASRTNSHPRQRLPLRRQRWAARPLHRLLRPREVSSVNCWPATRTTRRAWWVLFCGRFHKSYRALTVNLSERVSWKKREWTIKEHFTRGIVMVNSASDKVGGKIVRCPVWRLVEILCLQNQDSIISALPVHSLAATAPGGRRTRSSTFTFNQVCRVWRPFSFPNYTTILNAVNML